MQSRRATLHATVLLLLLTPALARAAARVVLIGDSITAGFVEGGGTPYADVLAAELGSGYEVVNAGCHGSTSADWLPNTSSPPFCADLAGRVLPHLPAAYATLMLGTVDAIGYLEPAPIPVEDYAANLAQIVDELLINGAETVALMTPPNRCGNAGQEVIDRLAGYAAEVLAHCLLRPELICGPDVYRLLDPAADADCTTHPTAGGHAKIGEALAAVLLAPPACGDSVLDIGEQCDDGNTTDGDCCSSTCTLPTDCFQAAKARFRIKDDSQDETNQVRLTWKNGESYDQSLLGDPSLGTLYTLCVYDSGAGVPELEMLSLIPPDSVPWRNRDPRGWDYKDKDATFDGVRKIRLRTGATGRTKMQYHAKGSNLSPILGPFDDGGQNRYFDVDTELRVFLVNSEGTCWDATFTSAKKNNALKFTAKFP